MTCRAAVPYPRCKEGVHAFLLQKGLSNVPPAAQRVEKIDILSVTVG